MNYLMDGSNSETKEQCPLDQFDALIDSYGLGFVAFELFSVNSKNCYCSLTGEFDCSDKNRCEICWRYFDEKVAE